MSDPLGTIRVHPDGIAVAVRGWRDDEPIWYVVNTAQTDNAALAVFDIPQVHTWPLHEADQWKALWRQNTENAAEAIRERDAALAAQGGCAANTCCCDDEQVVQPCGPCRCDDHDRCADLHTPSGLDEFHESTTHNPEEQQ